MGCLVGKRSSDILDLFIHLKRRGMHVSVVTCPWEKKICFKMLNMPLPLNLCCPPSQFQIISSSNHAHNKKEKKKKKKKKTSPLKYNKLVWVWANFFIFLKININNNILYKINQLFEAYIKNIMNFKI